MYHECYASDLTNTAVCASCLFYVGESEGLNWLCAEHMAFCLLKGATFISGKTRPGELPVSWQGLSLSYRWLQEHKAGSVNMADYCLVSM